MSNRPNTTSLRRLLSDFFQDIDIEAKIDAKLANAIIELYLLKFQFKIKEAKMEGKEEAFTLVEGAVKVLGDTKKHGIYPNFGKDLLKLLQSLKVK